MKNTTLGTASFHACLPARQAMPSRAKARQRLINLWLAQRAPRKECKLTHYPTFSLTTLFVLAIFGCNQVKTIENINGNVTDRYSVDKEGLKHGEFKRFMGKDTLTEVSNYVHGMLHGTRTIYNKLGKPEIVEHYVNDTLHGLYQVFDEKGEVKMEGEYADGVMLGVWKRYYPGAKILEEVTYKDNVENGPFSEYHENGKLKAKGQYLDGDFEHDTLYLYDDSGILERKMLCDRGICRTFWLAEGTPVEEATE